MSRRTPLWPHLLRGSMFRSPTTLMVSAVTLVALLMSGPGATAGSVRVQDVEEGQEAYFLGIASARFANQSSVVTMKATHPTLDLRYVDRFSLRMYVDRKLEVVNRRTYYLVWQATADAQFRKGLHLYRSEPGMEYPALVRCPGAKMKRVGADYDEGREGRVTARVPKRCVPGSRFIKFNYTVSNFGGDVHDTAPGGNTRFGTDTRWVKRG